MSGRLSERLILYFLFISMTAIGIVGIYSYQAARKAQMQRTYDQLASVKYLNKKQIEQFYSELTQLAASLAEHPGISRLNTQEQSPDLNNNPLSIPSLFSSHLQSGISRILLMDTGKIRILNGLVPAISPVDLRIPDSLIKAMNAKESLVTDFFQTSDSGYLVQWVIYRIPPGNRQGFSWLALEIPSSTIDSLMPSQHPLNGLGSSGEAYLVGRDRVLRTKSRFPDYADRLLKIDSSTADLAFSGQDGTWLLKDYRGIEVLGSFARLSADCPPWALIAEIDLEEAMKPISTIRNHVIFITVMIAAIVLLLTWFIARKITLPLVRLRKAALELAEGNTLPRVEVSSQDEIGELARTFNFMSEQIHEKELLLQQEKNRRMRAAFDGQDTERQRLARELHDGLGQSLIAQKLRLESFAPADSRQDNELIRELKASADELVDEVRRISNALMPAQLHQFGLAAAIRQQCEELARLRMIEVNFEATGDFSQLNRKSRTYIFRIVQEALNNIIKHSGAGIVNIELVRNRNHLYLSIADDGKGFDIGSVCLGNGLHNLRERVELLNGSINIFSEPGKGTTIEIQIPYKDAK